MLSKKRCLDTPSDSRTDAWLSSFDRGGYADQKLALFAFVVINEVVSAMDRHLMFGKSVS